MIKFKQEKYERIKDTAEIKISYYFDTEKMKIKFSIISNDMYQPVITLSYTKKRMSDFKLWLETSGFQLVNTCEYFKDVNYVI